MQRQRWKRRKGMDRFIEKQHAYSWPEDMPNMTLGNFINWLVEDGHTIKTVAFADNFATIVASKTIIRMGPTIKIIKRGEIKPEVIEREKQQYNAEATTTICPFCETVFQHTQFDARHMYSNGNYMIDCPVCYRSLGEIHRKQ